jgi:hypothetical protein
LLLSFCLFTEFLVKTNVIFLIYVKKRVDLGFISRDLVVFVSSGGATTGRNLEGSPELEVEDEVHLLPPF